MPRCIISFYHDHGETLYEVVVERDQSKSFMKNTNTIIYMYKQSLSNKESFPPL